MKEEELMDDKQIIVKIPPSPANHNTQLHRIGPFPPHEFCCSFPHFPYLYCMPLTDQFGRRHDYLRISLVDKCNLRCTYCMPENIRFLPQSHLMTREEIQAFARLFVEELGVKKIRITGGEPLLRQDAGAILDDLGQLNVRLGMTTNAILLADHFERLKRIGLTSLNISLDTLQRERFRVMTRRDQFEVVHRNILRALDEGFRVKVNAVVMRGQNEDELVDFVRWTRDLPVHIRFIEFMPFDGNAWKWDLVVGHQEMLGMIQEEFEVEKLKDGPHSTAKAYQARGHAGTFAVISTITEAFCSSCNRIRLTAEGKLRNCLFSRSETDLLTPYRQGEDIRPLIVEAIHNKHARLGGLPEFQDEERIQSEISQRAMVKIGG